MASASYAAQHQHLTCRSLLCLLWQRFLPLEQPFVLQELHLSLHLALFRDIPRLFPSVRRLTVSTRSAVGPQLGSRICSWNLHSLRLECLPGEWPHLDVYITSLPACHSLQQLEASLSTAHIVLTCTLAALLPAITQRRSCTEMQQLRLSHHRRVCRHSLLSSVCCAWAHLLCHVMCDRLCMQRRSAASHWTTAA